MCTWIHMYIYINIYIYTYTAVRLELLDSYLKDFDAIPVTSQIKFQPKNLKHRKIEKGFPIGPGSEIKHMVYTYIYVYTYMYTCIYVFI
jgi:hypothetical protein